MRYPLLLLLLLPSTGDGSQRCGWGSSEVSWENMYISPTAWNSARTQDEPYEQLARFRYHEVKVRVWFPNPGNGGHSQRILFAVKESWRKHEEAGKPQCIDMFFRCYFSDACVGSSSRRHPPVGWQWNYTGRWMDCQGKQSGKFVWGYWRIWVLGFLFGGFAWRRSPPGLIWVGFKDGICADFGDLKFDGLVFFSCWDLGFGKVIRGCGSDETWLLSWMDWYELWHF